MDNIIRTPEERFENLPGYNFTPNYVQLDNGLRMHYVDEGRKSDSVVLLLHGEPSWSFLYRYMIPPLADNNFRVIAPDLVGFGKSDKWTQQDAYSYQNHIEWLAEFIKKLELKDIVLFCQDWGGLIGLRIVANNPSLFSHIIASNTALPTGTVEVPEMFKKWRIFSQKSPDFDIGKVIEMGTISSLSEEVISAYNAPFPSEVYKAGARIFPMLVPIEEKDPEASNNIHAWEELMQWEKPFLTAFGSGDEIMKGADTMFQKLIPGCKNQDHKILEAGHFIQEEKGEELAKCIIDFYDKN
jgi:haloalkane dehalogenase